MTKPNLPYLLIDIGGTYTRLTACKNGISFVEPEVFKTPKNFSKAIKKIKLHADKSLGNEKPGIVIAGVAGPLNTDKSALTNPPNLKPWSGKPLRNKLSNIFGTQVFLENDTAIVGLGEASKGAGVNYSIVSYITVSTGINGARIIDKKIDRNAQGFEVGHHIIDADKSILKKSKGELEDFISGREIKKRFDKDPFEIEDNNIWSEVAKYLAVGIHNTILFWSPEVVVLGGSLMKKISLSETKKELEKIMKIHPKLPEIKKAQLGNFGGLWGALEYANSL